MMSAARHAVLGPRGDERPALASAALARSCSSSWRAEALFDLISWCSGCGGRPDAAPPAWAFRSEEAIVRPADPLTQPLAADGSLAEATPAGRIIQPVN